MKRSQNVLVIGAGVSGLTTALALADSAKVTIVAERPPQQTVSTVAGALWEWPPAVCGHHRDQGSLARSKQWCTVSYAIFFLIKKTIGLRVDETEEVAGLDISSHGMYGYPESFIPPEEYPGGPEGIGVTAPARSPATVGATAMTAEPAAGKPTI